MRCENSIEQGHVGKISKHSAMNTWIIGKPAARAQPDILLKSAPLMCYIARQIEGAHFDRALPLEPATDRSRHYGAKALQHFRLAGKRFWRRDFGHWHSMFEPRLLNLERGRK